MEKDYSMLDQQCVRSAQEVEQLKADKAQISTLLSSKGNCGESEREMTREISPTFTSTSYLLYLPAFY